MYLVLIILILVAAILLVLVVLAQNSKGGMGAAFGGGGASQMMGVKKTTDLLEKMTWALIAIVISFSVAANVMKQPSTDEEEQTGPVDANVESAAGFPQTSGAAPAQTVQEAPAEAPAE